MKNLNMSQLFEKLNDVKSLFIYGQKIIPVLQSLVDFMQETVPLLENINHSIADSTSKIPRATDQINNVTNATELATTEILDLVDVISNNLSTIDNSLKDITEKEKIKSSVIEKLKALLPDNAEAMQLFQEYKDNDVTISQIEKLSEVFPKIQNDTYNITLSLQVQDITSQQLAAVNHLIESVQTKLASLIHDIDDTNLKEVQSSENYSTPEGATFDPNASYDKSGDRQDMIDEIIQSENQKASQDEIDKLFS
ncbi:MAG: protein phosphatase CheZ [Bacteroidota bacterium]|nr:protein phosphatase CheZ [Bacteroidota bacterium]MDP4191439.1 protein phosphatase CheZ [Bacteroidota bacterium]MDP4194386.1 protein phosphatase CheZ [Bacteroidota bacterium]